MSHFKSKLLPALLIGSSLTLVGCGHNDDDDDEMVTPPVVTPTPVNVTYEVTVTNLTYGQPLSPIAVALHDEGNLWMIGENASTELETLAEGGDNSELLGNSVILASTSGEAPLGPGASQTLTVTIQDNESTNLSVVTMLVNTNDAFSGLNSVSLAELAVGDSWSAMAPVYDAGTEANSEMAGTIPGPADGGAGYDAMRDDVDFVAMHPGVVTMDDGLTTSVLTQAHRFDNPAMKVTVTRTE